MRKVPIEAEQAVLGAILLDDAILPLVRDRCRPEDFTDARHQLVWRAIVEIAAEGRRVDEVTVVTWLKIRGHTEQVQPLYLAQLVERVPTTARVEDYVEELRRASAVRVLYRAAIAAQRALADGADADDVLEQIQSVARGIEQREPDAMADMVDELQGVLSEMEQRADKGVAVAPGAFVPTGLRALDDKIVGFASADLVIVAAKSGIGKTALAINMAARQAADGKRVAVFSGEMTCKAIARRLMACTAPVDHHRLRAGLFVEQDWPRAVNAIGKFQRARFLINDTIKTIGQVCSLAMRAHAAAPLDIVYVDYLQHLVPHGDDQHRETAVARGAVELKNLARRLDIPVVALSQLSDAGQLRESRVIFHTASVVLELERADDATTEATIRVKKHRDGSTGSVTVGWSDNTVRFYDLIGPPVRQTGGSWIDSTEPD